MLHKFTALYLNVRFVSLIETEKTLTLKRRGEIIMVILNFIVAIVALIIAIIAFQKTGGIVELRKNSAELLAKMEKMVR